MRTLPRYAQCFQHAEMIGSRHFFANADTLFAPGLLDQAVVSPEFIRLLRTAQCNELASGRGEVGGAASAHLRWCEQQIARDIRAVAQGL